MTIGVMVRGALKSGSIAIVPLETAWVEPSISAIRASCDRELRALYPLDFAISSYEVVGIEAILSKILANR